MKHNPEIIKALAQTLNSHPEWTGPNGVFYNRFSGYAGVKIFAEYTKRLRLANGNEIPANLQKKAYDYIDYLNQLPEDKKESYSRYFKNAIPKINEMIRSAKMTKESILAFANIFNELGIGQNPSTIIADYQTAISEALKSKMTTAPSAQTPQTAQKYKQLSFSDKEKAEIIEKCRQKGVLVSAGQLDGYYVESSSGAMYEAHGNPVEETAVGSAIVQTLAYQIGIGNAEKMNMKSAEIAGVLAICEMKGIIISREELENIYIDKDGKIYYNDGTMITDVDLGTAIQQTETYKEKYEKFAEKRGRQQVGEIPRAEEKTENPQLVIPEKLAEMKQLLKTQGGTAATREGGSSSLETTGSEMASIRQKGGLVLPTGEVVPLKRGLKSSTLTGGWNRKEGLRRRQPSQTKTDSQTPSQPPSQPPETPETPEIPQIPYAQQNKQAQGPAPQTQGSIPYIPHSKKKGSVGKKIAAIAGGGLLVGSIGKYVGYAYFLPDPQTHNFVINILKIIFQ
ncbi:MAG: hypothetical protein PHP74_00340 [Candidatus Gracilibacteria bacterium]|nr:hypothetical protein [Candidatus Gracilibacteria bacterium]